MALEIVPHDPTPSTKRCTTCGNKKPLDDFYAQATGRHGHRAECKECQNRRRRELLRAVKGTSKERGRRPLYGPPPPSKICTECGDDKPLDAYGKQQGGRFGLHPRCKVCRRRAEQGRYLQKRDEILAKQKLNPRRRENQKWSERKVRYGVTREMYEAMHQAQDGRCAVCLDRAEVLCIDHDHETGAVRGLLCGACNVGLGHLKDDPMRLLSAVEYLRNPPAMRS